MANWKEKLGGYSTSELVLFDDSFLERFGELDWVTKDADQRAAGEFHTQLATRITTQPLRYADGDEQTALESLYRLFGTAREVQDRNFGSTQFEAITWHILNTFVRPFTSKWHRRSLAGELSALDDTDEFRSELEELRPVLMLFDELLLEIRDGQRPPSAPSTEKINTRLEREMKRSLAWGIVQTGSAKQKACADAMNAAERHLIVKRREYYDIDSNRDYASGLALSGGGIRSATFSLGVLIALARRNLLPEFDYLSTVSGGGYLGSFLTTYLSTTESPKDKTSENLGLRATQRPFLKEEGEAQAIRHLRHHSKFLQTSWTERFVMTASQIYGMLVNMLVLALIPAIFAVVEYLLRTTADALFPQLKLAVIAATGLAATALLLPALARWCSTVKNHADAILASVLIPMTALALWPALGLLHKQLNFFDTEHYALPPATVALVTAGSIPILSIVLISLVGHRNTRLKILLAAVAGWIAPLFVVGLELLAYGWLAGVSLHAVPWTPIFRCGALAIAILSTYFLVCVPLDINFTSLHRHYRRKLSEAFLIQPSVTQDPQQPYDVSVRIKLSQMNSENRAPYHLLNAALNVPSSNNPAMQGRLTDFFTFSRDFCGSPLIGYEKTETWEGLDTDLDLATAMATSGAAASPLMGLQTQRFQSFWLAILNIRLGYWLKNPFCTDARKKSAPGLRYLLGEIFGRIDEKAGYLNVTDGGHIENLGVYELLRRRCKYIVAVDGEHDPAMTFHALTTLQRLASIDLDVSIEINLDDLRLQKGGVSRSHFQMCRIRYPKTVSGSAGTGYLIYVKLSLTGNEGEFIRRYRQDEPDFPHHSTANQFFTEAQFEAYRALGEHVGDKLFMKAIVGDFCRDDTPSVEDWFARAGQSVLT